jgi:hypothetical protein
MKNLIKTLLNESLSFDIVENMMIDEEYPSTFDMDHFKTLTKFAERVRYCEEHLKRISSGSSRIVYMIDNTKVLKLAKNKKGIAQNEVEIQWGQDSYFGSILAHTFMYHPNDLWVEMELARKVSKKDFTRLTDCTIEEMNYYIRNIKEINNRRRPIFHIAPEVEDRLRENEFVSSIIEFMENIDAPAGDFGKLNSYGIVQRGGQDDIVLIDFGLTNDVYQTYYS